MKQLFALFFLCLSFHDFAQLNHGKVYSWKEVQQANPDTIYAISFEKLKLDSLPDGNTDDGKKVFVIRSANISIGKIHLGKREIYGFYNYGDEIKIDEKIPVDEKSIGTIGSDIVQNKVLIIDFRNSKNVEK